MVWSEGNMSLKNPVTPPGIDPRTVQLVAQRLNHYATPGPHVYGVKPESNYSETQKCSGLHQNKQRQDTHFSFHHAIY